MHLFYQPELTNGLHRLSEEESGHAVRVMRMGIGDRAEVTDGRGTRATVELSDTNKRGCAFQVLEQRFSGRPAFPNVAIAPTKNMDRLEWFLEKAVEIGVGSVCPILCSNSERRILKPDRCEKVMLAAMKQSQQDWLPALLPFTPFMDFLKQTDGHLLLAHCRDGEKLPIRSKFANGSWILIGPEGDFTVQEVEAAMQHGATAVSLGNNRLRTETAGIFALSVVTSGTE
ncbi:MAG: 16S rRNA (uracil(1498)-N(3))-methyltransferase [Flavobacteriales bacterium]|nr:16S rRNA (uracil(1498)-N(3))-methyltransferase [Flavobacteriales bacterium]